MRAMRVVITQELLFSLGPYGLNTIIPPALKSFIVFLCQTCTQHGDEESKDRPQDGITYKYICSCGLSSKKKKRQAGLIYLDLVLVPHVGKLQLTKFSAYPSKVHQTLKLSSYQ